MEKNVHKLSFILIGCLFLFGCSWLSSSSHSTSQTSDLPDENSFERKLWPVENDSLPVPAVCLGKIVDAQPLSGGGNIRVIPFYPGERVFADDTTDHLALLIYRGLYDQINQTDKGLLVVQTEETPEDFVITGTITKIRKPSKLKKWFLRSNKIALSVKGKMVDAKTRNTLIVFEDTIEGNLKETDLNQLALEAGRNIGDFILSAREQSVLERK